MFVVDLGTEADCSYSIVGVSAARLYPLSIMVGEGDFMGKQITLFTMIPQHTKRIKTNTPTEANAEAALWSSLEANVSIICICLPPLHPLLSRAFSFFWLPRPINSRRPSKTYSNRTQMTEPLNRDGGIWCNELFSPGPTSYSASISKVDTNEEAHENEEGIRVKRELRMQSENIVTPSRRLSANGAPLDMEMGEGAAAAMSHPAPENPYSISSVERDFGDFEFPDYKERMNAPI